MWDTGCLFWSWVKFQTCTGNCIDTAFRNLTFLFGVELRRINTPCLKIRCRNWLSKGTILFSWFFLRSGWFYIKIIWKHLWNTNIINTKAGDQFKLIVLFIQYFKLLRSFEAMFIDFRTLWIKFQHVLHCLIIMIRNLAAWSYWLTQFIKVGLLSATATV